MMNFYLRGFALGLRQLSEATRFVQETIQEAEAPHAKITLADASRIDERLQDVAQHCRRLDLVNAKNRLERTFLALSSRVPKTYETIESELITLYEAIEDDLKAEYFYHYPRDKARRVLFHGDWNPVFAKFPSAKVEAEAGIDCYALGHSTACIFHMMRVSEFGMRALARERKVTFPRHPLEWAEWQSIISEIVKKTETATSGMSRGPAKDAAEAFYTNAVAQLRAFKETRNRIMHMRGTFDELDAQRAMNQVRDFMSGLSTKVGETTRRSIRRWL